MWANGVELQELSWVSVDSTNRKWNFYTNDVALSGKSFMIDTDWTWDDTFGFSQVYSFQFQVNIVGGASSTSSTTA
jgi:hypothetical protein